MTSSDNTLLAPYTLPPDIAKLRGPQYQKPVHERKVDNWVYFALADQVMNRKSDQDIAGQRGITLKAWRRHKYRDKAKAFRKRLDELVSEPEKIARLLLAANGNYAAEGLLLCAKTLYENNEYDQAAKHYTKALELAGVRPEPKREEQQPQLPPIIILQPAQLAAIREAIPEAEWQALPSVSNTTS